jgi:hypothetical protein
MVKEIKFLVTGEVRRPKMGDWFLSAKGVPICAGFQYQPVSNIEDGSCGRQRK